ncbi:MAG: UDP-glucose 4-epimerase [Streptomycetaceae bacterium]|nr:UDP-glucose 4-epimerase [Streptomycetaceae bacterium]
MFSSTAAVYGDPDTTPVRETAAARPTSPYGASKLAVGHMIGGYARAYGLAAVSLRYWPTPDGTCIRDYIHVAGLARAHLLALDAAAPGRHEVCNLGNGVGFSVREVVDTARRVTGHPIPAVDGPRRVGDPAILVASAERARTLLGWQPEHPDLERIIADAWDLSGRLSARRSGRLLPD